MDRKPSKVLMEQIGAGQKVIGFKQVLRHAQENRLSVIYLAKDADLHIASALQAAAKDRRVPVETALSRKTLGEACGIDVGAACVGMLIEAEKP